MPQSAVFSPAEDTAANCAPGSATAADIHSQAVRALVIVSVVVKVLDATITSVVAGSQAAMAPATSAASTFETKWTRGPAA